MGDSLLPARRLSAERRGTPASAATGSGAGAVTGARPAASSATVAATTDSTCSCRPLPSDLPVQMLHPLYREDRANPRLLVLSAGYERRAWRAAGLARHVIEWVEDFAMRPAERANLGHGRSISMISRAMRATFGTRTGTSAAGEVLLHAICRQFFGASTVIHKIHFKSASNDQVKGYDAVHAVHAESGELQLWLGEAKFYSDIAGAISAALKDLRDHFQLEYVRSEFGVVADKIEPDHPHYDELVNLMDPATTVEDVFDRVVVPVFCTYDSDATVNHETHCAQYVSDVTTEAVKALEKLSAGVERLQHESGLDLPGDILLILLPLATKDELVEALREQLASWRTP